MVEEEKQEHMEKVKELLGWVSTLVRNAQSKATSSQTKELTDIEKAILEQQVGRRSTHLFMDRIICDNTQVEQCRSHVGHPRMMILINVNFQDFN